LEQGQMRQLIRETLQKFEHYSESAEELLMLTAAQESLLGYYIEQVKGPAIGIFQMEIATYDDIYKNYLAYNHLTCMYLHNASQSVACMVNADTMRFNLKYAICMARIHYLRVEEPLPKAWDWRGLAEYYKRYYNTYKGSATVEEAIDNYKKYAI